MEKKYTFSNWSIDRKIRALELMDKYLKKNVPRSVYDIEWERHGAHPFQRERCREIAEDDDLFIEALFCFYVCLTTDLSWLKI